MVAVGVLEGMLAALVGPGVGVLVVVVVVEPAQDASKVRQKRSKLTHIAGVRFKNIWHPS